MSIVRSVSALAIIGVLAACGSSGGTDIPPGDDASIDDTSVVGDGTPADTAGDVAPSDGGPCTTDTQCSSLLGKVTPVPAGCAEAYCIKASGTCGLRPVDADGDGFRVAKCDVPGFAGFDKGTDCDDADKLFSPGKSRDCSATADGTKISWPSGKPQGECKYGSETCASDGKTGACLNAIAPAKLPVCSSDKDSTCVGKKDSELCGCKIGDKQTCHTGAAPASGKGPCKDGSQVCIASPTEAGKAVWDTCAGEILPAPKDGCTPGDDATCDGVPNVGCECTGDVTAAAACPGTCSNGTHRCNTATGKFIDCLGAVNKATNVGACGNCDYCPGTTPCTPPGKVACTDGGCSGQKCPGAATCTWTDTTRSCGACPAVACGATCSTTKSCGLCPAVACGGSCHALCPAGWTFGSDATGAYCESVTSFGGGFGVTTPTDRPLATGTMPSAPGTIDRGSYIRITGTQSTTDHCGNSSSAYPMTVTCGGASYPFGEDLFAVGAGRTMACAPGTAITVSHTGTGTTCCFGGCSRSFTIEPHARVSYCDTF